MDADMRDRIEREAEKNALFNALKHESDAQVGAIMGPLMGENPEFREHGDQVAGVVAPVVNRVNGLSVEEKRERLEELAPELVEELDAEEEEAEFALPDLPNVEEYDSVRMRCAPNPNGPWHIGHGRMPAVIGTYKEMYDGEFIVRFDDTDPETKRPRHWAYDQILDDIEYLGFEPDDVIRASDRLDTYYDYARTLVDMGGAYTCSCPGETFSDLKNQGEPCPHRDKDVHTVEEEFDAMVDGEYRSGEMVLRVKTDITHKNPALRDWVAFRIIDTPHPREEAADYRCWPMLDFQSGIDDHRTDVTHIIRGIDLQDSAKRQQFVYDYFDWEYPEVVHWGHVQIDAYDVKMSTSRIGELIEAGELDGWDDPRAPTLMSVRRRGIQGQAIVDAMTSLGTSTSDVDLAMTTIYANNRDIVDDDAPRCFFVRADFDARGGDADQTYEAVEVPLVGGPGAANPPVHPDHEDRGTRNIPVGDAVYVEARDLPPEGERVWLKGLGPVRFEDGTFEHTDDDIEIVRSGNAEVVHWAPVEGSVRVRTRTMEGDVSGYAEPGFVDYDPDDVLQFVRVGFVRVDRHGAASRAANTGNGDERRAEAEESVAYYSHP